MTAARLPLWPCLLVLAACADDGEPAGPLPSAAPSFPSLPPPGDAGADASASGAADAQTGVDAAQARSVCSSGSHWEDGNDGDRRMNPGRACIACHEDPPAEADKPAPRFRIAGTVYRTVREPDLCDGVDGNDGDPHVRIVDSAGSTHRLEVNEVGNFFTEDAVSFPIRATLVYQGRERAMGTMQTTGDCNQCHTESGANGAPGRIYLP